MEVKANIPGNRRQKLYVVIINCFLAFAIWFPVVVHAEKVSVELYPDDAGTDKTNPIVMNIDATLYSTGWWFDQIDAKQYTLAQDEAFIFDALRINRDGTVQDIQNLWLPEERADISNVLANMDVLKANQSFLANLKNSTFLAKILYGNYTIFLIQHSSSTIGDIVNFYTIKKLDGKYYLTNYLKNDSVLKVIIYKYLPTLTLKVR
jgi:hypothetical protein